MQRQFVYNGQTYPDPDPNMSIDDVRSALADFMGEVANADVVESVEGDMKTIEFKRKVGTKGTD